MKSANKSCRKNPGLNCNVNSPLLFSSLLFLFLFLFLLCSTQVQLLVDEYKAAHLAISQRCSEISEVLLVHVDGKTVYKDLEFEQVQQGHQQSQLRRLKTAHQDIIDIMSRIYEIFHNDGPKVRVGLIFQPGSFFPCVLYSYVRHFAHLRICRWVLLHTKYRCLTPPACTCVCAYQPADGKLQVCVCLCGVCVYVFRCSNTG